MLIPISNFHLFGPGLRVPKASVLVVIGISSPGSKNP